MDNDVFPDGADASARPPAPPPAGHRELVTVLAATCAGLPLREIAVRLHGADRVTAEWACDSRVRGPHTAPRQQGADARGTGQPRPSSRTLTPACALLRSRPAAFYRQPRCASHHQAPHTGRLSATA